MIEDASTEVPKKKGWPKGKPRGPRKPKDVVQTGPQPGPTPTLPPRSFAEPVDVQVIYKTGQVAQFTASTFELGTLECRFWSYPEQRGFKQLHLIQKSEIIALSITAPEMFFEQLKTPAPAPVPVDVPGLPAADPRRYVNGDPQISVAPRGRAAINRATGASVMGLPRTEARVFDKGELVDTPIGASMV